MLFSLSRSFSCRGGTEIIYTWKNEGEFPANNTVVFFAINDGHTRKKGAYDGRHSRYENPNNTFIRIKLHLAALEHSSYNIPPGGYLSIINNVYREIYFFFSCNFSIFR